VTTNKFEMTTTFVRFNFHTRDTDELSSRKKLVERYCYCV